MEYSQHLWNENFDLKHKYSEIVVIIQKLEVGFRFVRGTFGKTPKINSRKILQELPKKFFENLLLYKSIEKFLKSEEISYKVSIKQNHVRGLIPGIRW